MRVCFLITPVFPPHHPTNTGKGRQLAAVILDSVARGRPRHVWVSTSGDLAVDALRDLDAVGATDVAIVPAASALGPGATGPRGNAKPTVMFITYTTLASAGGRASRSTRLDQLIRWCGGATFDGVLAFDEAHKAKNFTAGTAAAAAVIGVQDALPGARVIYASATGVSSVSHMAYLSRIGVFGPGTPFPDFKAFNTALSGKGIPFMELMAQSMKAEGSFVARGLSFNGCDFSTRACTIDADAVAIYDASVALWRRLYTAVHAVHGHTADWRFVNMAYFGAVSRYFRGLTVALKVPEVAAAATAALHKGNAVVIGLQTTGESASTAADLSAGDRLAAPPSTARETLLAFIKKYLGDDDEMEDDPPPPPQQCTATGRPLRAAAATTRQRAASAEAVVLSSDEDDDGPQKKKATTPPSSPSSPSDEDSSSDDDSDSDSGLMIVEDDGTEVAVKSTAKAAVAAAARAADDRSPTPARAARADTPAPTPPGPVPVSRSAAATPGVEDGDGGVGGGDAVAPAEIAPVSPSAAAAADAPMPDAPPPLEPPREPVYDPATCRALLADVRALPLPPAPLDDLMDRLGGPDAVAEMTGRKLRVVRVSRAGEDGADADAFVVQSRASGRGGATDSVNVEEARHFNAGDKLVALISDAASTGVSLHAGLTFGNQRRRVHITLELAWAADKTLQQLGRSHRAAQASAPVYLLTQTPLGGESRFASAVGRRLQSLGALTRGDRRAASGSSTLADSAMLDSALGKNAVCTMLSCVGMPDRQPVFSEGGEGGGGRNAAPTPSRRGRRGSVSAATAGATAAARARTAAAALASDAPASDERDVTGLLPDGVTLRMLRDGVTSSLAGLPESLRTDPVLEPLLRDAAGGRDGAGVATAAEQVRTVADFHRAAAADVVEAGLSIEDLPKGSEVTRFLNRLLGSRVAAQVALFAYFSACLDAEVATARRNGTHDAGPGELTVADEDMSRLLDGAGAGGEGGGGGADGGGGAAPGGDDTAAANPTTTTRRRGETTTTVWTFPNGQSIVAHRLVVDRGLSSDAAHDRLRAHQLAGPNVAAESGFYTSRAGPVAGGRSLLLALAKPAAFAGAAIAAYDVWRPNTGVSHTPFTAFDLATKYARLDDGSALAEWAEIHADTLRCHHGAACPAGATCASGGGRLHPVTLLTGPVYRAWDTLDAVLKSDASLTASDKALRTLRTARPDGTSLVGVKFPPEKLAMVTARLQGEADRAAERRAAAVAAAVAAMQGGGGGEEGGAAAAGASPSAPPPASLASPPPPSPAQLAAAAAADAPAPEAPAPVVAPPKPPSSGRAAQPTLASLWSKAAVKREAGGSPSGASPAKKQATTGAVVKQEDVETLRALGLGEADARRRIAAHGGDVAKVADEFFEENKMGAE